MRNAAPAPSDPDVSPTLRALLLTLATAAPAAGYLAVDRCGGEGPRLDVAIGLLTTATWRLGAVARWVAHASSGVATPSTPRP